MLFYQLIIKHIERSGLTRGKVAGLIQIDPSHFSQVLTGTYSVLGEKYLLRLCEVLELSESEGEELYEAYQVLKSKQLNIRFHYGDEFKVPEPLEYYEHEDRETIENFLKENQLC